MYQVQILDKQKRLKALLSGVHFKYSRAINTASSVEVKIPGTVIEENIPFEHSLHEFLTTQNKMVHAEIASFIKITKGSSTVITGKIVGRQIKDGVIINALTEECILESNLTPAQYGSVWEGWDLADLARDLKLGWQVLRIKSQSQWQARLVASSNIDLTSEPGVVMLAKRSSGRYYSSGYITLKFDKSEIFDFDRWDRVRWSADSDGPDGIVQTSIQISTDGSGWSEAFDGGLPEEVGYSVPGKSDSIWVRINLSTQDTESEDPNGKITGVTPRAFACEMIARTESILLADEIPEVTGEIVKGLSANHTGALKVMVEACEKAGYEFCVINGTINLAKKLGVDRTKDFVFRASTNMEVLNLGDDDSDLVNVLTAYGPGSGINRLQTTLRDFASISDYGEYPGSVEFEADSLEKLLEKADEYLKEHNQPKMRFEIATIFPYGEEPEYGLGDTVKVADPKSGVISTTRIVHESRTFDEQGLAVSLELGKPSFTLTQAIGKDGKDGQDGKDGKDGRPGRDGKDGDELPLPADPFWLDYYLSDTLHLSWQKAQFASGYEIRTNLNWGTAEGTLYRGYAHSFNFLPVERQMILYLRALNALGEYSINYDTLNVSLPAPMAPQMPDVISFFGAVKIKVIPVNLPSIMGYYAYIKVDGEIDKLLMYAGQDLTYYADKSKELEIQISAFDVIGEGARSQVIVAVTESLTTLDLPQIPKNKLEESLQTEIDLGVLAKELAETADSKATGAMQEIDELEGAITTTTAKVENVEGEVVEHAAQIQQLGDEITLKVQRRKNGEMVVTGIGIGFDETGQSIIPVVADRFVVTSAASGDNQYVFMVDTTTNKVYLAGDMVVDGLLRAEELQADVAKTLLLKAELAILDEANVLKLRADKITVGGSSQSGFSVQGAGGYIIIDSEGQRFYKVGKTNPTIEFSTVTGDAKFSGDISGSSGKFEGPDGKVEISGSGLVLKDNAGNTWVQLSTSKGSTSDQLPSYFKGVVDCSGGTLILPVRSQ